MYIIQEVGAETVIGISMHGVIVIDGLSCSLILQYCIQTTAVGLDT